MLDFDEFLWSFDKILGQKYGIQKEGTMGHGTMLPKYATGTGSRLRSILLQFSQSPFVFVQICDEQKILIAYIAEFQL